MCDEATVRGPLEIMRCLVMLDTRYPKVWDEVIESISKNERVMVIGGTDRGKSTFSIYASMRKDMPLLDADIGQATVPPPTVVKLSEDRISIKRGFFVGATTPVRNFLAYVLGMYVVSRELSGMIIDTCGLIRGLHGFWLKLTEAMILNPDLIIAMSRGGDLDHILPAIEDFLGKEVLDIGASPYARRRSMAERYERRKMKFKMYFGDGKTISIREPRILSFPKKWNVSPSLLAAVTSGSVKRASVINDTLYLICKEYCRGVRALKSLYSVREYTIVSERNVKNLLVGLYSGDEFLGVGIVESFDEDSLEFIIYVSDRFDEDKKVTSIQLGSIKLNKEGDEIRR